MPEKTFLIHWDVIRSGQTRPYEDSIFEYKIYSDRPENEVERFCLEFVRPSKVKAKDNDKFDGKCGFPYGLDSYYSLQKIGENIYRYLVCYPYTG